MRRLNAAGLPPFIDLLPPLARLDEDRMPNAALDAYLHVLQSQADAIGGDIDRLYDNWFIETCEAWLAPYIGALVGAPPDLANPSRIPRQRAYVANLLRYRGRRGGAAALAGALQDATGWAVDIVEGLDLQMVTALKVNSHANQPRTVRLSDAREFEPGVAELARASYATRSRNGASYNGAKTALAVVWRAETFEMRNSELRLDPDLRFSFHPARLRTALRAPAPSFPVDPHLPTRLACPRPLTRDTLRNQLASGGSPDVHLRLNGRSLAASDLRVADLSDDDWSGVRAELQSQCETAQSALVALDPEIGVGVLATPASSPVDPDATDLRADFWTAHIGRFGGGAYSRSERLLYADTETWTVLIGPGSARTSVLAVDAHHQSWEDALTDWRQSHADKALLCLIADNDWRKSRTNILDVSSIPTPVAFQAMDGFRPVLDALDVIRTHPGGRVSLSGFVLPRPLQIQGGGTVDFLDCTVWADQGAALDLRQASGSSIHMAHCLCGPIETGEADVSVTVIGGIVDGREGAAIGCDADTGRSQTTLVLKTCTLIGPVQARSVIEASNALCTGQVQIKDNQPAACIDGLYAPGQGQRPPSLLSWQAGEALYAVLADDNPSIVAQGGEGGGEYGVYHNHFTWARRAAAQRVIEAFAPIDVSINLIDAEAQRIAPSSVWGIRAHDEG
ncbi:MAG: hypothetical protein JKP96_04785 [Oceanicaulis sp.]|jgi:hypothetical protein|nr:hypothetical protein [Oceanicaulis sp.]